MAVDNAVDEYKKIVRTLNKIRNLLHEKLDGIGVPIQGNPSLNTLMSKVNPIDINSAINKQLSNIPIDTTQHFNSRQEVYNYFHTDIQHDLQINDAVDISVKVKNNNGNPISNQTVYLYTTDSNATGSNRITIESIKKNNFILSQANLLLIRKFLFYFEYLKCQLENMGIPKSDIKEAKTITDLISLIDQIERIKKVIISSDSEVLYVGRETSININVVDDVGNSVEAGIIKIYAGSSVTNTPYRIYELNDDFLIKVDDIGQYTYTIEYVNTNLENTVTYTQYQPTDPITITLNAIYEELDGTLIAKNMNMHSQYYWLNNNEVAGYRNDYWDFDIQITNTNGESINSVIPFNIYINDTDHLLVSGETDILGNATISNVTIPYYSSDFINFREEAISNFAKIEKNYQETFNNIIQEDDLIDISVKLVDSNNNPVINQTISFYQTTETHSNASLLKINNVQKIIIDKNPFTLTGTKNISYDGESEDTGPMIMAQLPTPEKDENVYFYCNYDDDDLLDNLFFIKNPTIVDNKITYQRVKYTGENTINELNGCITDVRIVNGTLEYDVFNTTQKTKLKNINNLTEKLKSLVTEIFYNNKNAFDYETVGIKKYEYNKENTNANIPLILKTNLNQLEYPDTEFSTLINIYHTPISISDDYLTWYKTDPDIPSSIPITFHDKYTGDIVDYLDNTFYIGINGKYYFVDSPTFNYPININSLPYGNNNLIVTLTYAPFSISFNLESDTIQLNEEKNIGYIILTDDNGNPISNQEVNFYNVTDEASNKIFTMHAIMKILSNFILPSKTLYYLNDTPEIYYKPKGVAQQSQQVRITATNSALNGNYYTQSNGLIHSIQEWLTATIYNLTLKAASQGLTEERTFSYELKKPFKIEQTSYNRTQSATYKIIIYDNEHIDWNTITPQPYITVTNNGNNVNYLYESPMKTSSELTYNITINTPGTNTLTVNINGYSETKSIKIYTKLFEITSGTQYTLGTNKIFKIKCNDNDVSTMNIYGNGITQNSITSSIVNGEKIFTINCTITQAAPNGTSLYMTDNQGVTENVTVYIPKADITSTYTMAKSEYIYGVETPIVTWNIQPTPTSENITIIYNNGIKSQAQVKGIGTQKQYTFDNLKNAVGTYTTSITFTGNNNYNSFSKEISYTILQNEVFISNISLNGNGDLVLSTVSRSDINNTNLVSNISLDNQDLTITTKNVASGTNVANVVKNVSINNDDNLIFDIDSTNYIVELISNNITTKNENIELKFVVKNENNNKVSNMLIDIYEVK